MNLSQSCLIPSCFPCRWALQAYVPESLKVFLISTCGRMCYILKYRRTESVCIYVSLVVLAFSVTYIKSLIKTGYTCYSLMWTQNAVLWFYLYYRAGETWGERKQLSCFSAYITQSFMYCIFCSICYSYSHYSTKHYLERVKQQETSCKTKLITLSCCLSAQNHRICMFVILFLE